MHAAEDIEKHIQSIAADTTEFERSLATLPHWIPSSEVALVNTTTSMETVLERHTDLKELMESVTDMLNEDAGYLLRLANSAISKAQVS
jgi:hypothetical protein